MKPLHTVLVTQWFPPEPAHTPHWIARALRKQGLHTEVLTGIPNYPTGKVAEGYRAFDRRTEVVDGFSVHRTPLFPNHGSGAIGRILNYLSWALSAALVGVWKLRRADVLLVYSSPATAALPAMVAKRMFGVPYVLLVQDVWPDSVFSSGFMTGRSARAIERILHAFVDRTYRSADHVGVISPGMVDLLVSRGVPRDKVSIVYNWVDETEPVLRPRPRSELGVEDEDFVVMYAGNHGAAQALDTVVEAVGLFGEEAKVRLILVGDGVEKSRLRELADRVAKGRVTFLDPQPRAEMGALMAASDVQLVSLAARSLFEVTMPSKLQSVMAAGHPVLAVAAGDVRRVVETSNCGEAAVPGDVADVARAISTLLAAGSDALAQMGLRGQTYYITEMGESVGSNRLAAVLSAAARRRK